MYSYCGNNPVVYIDYSGTSFRPVGAGVQLEFDYGCITFGLEFIVYWDVNECGDGGIVIAVYSYEGTTIDLSDDLLGSVLLTITDNASLIMNGSEAGINKLIDILTNGLSCSISGVLIMGDENFTSVDSYAGPFTSINGGIGKLKGSYAYSENCMAIAIGGAVVGASKPYSFGVSRTNYTLLTTIEFGTQTMVPKSNGYTYTRYIHGKGFGETMIHV